MTANTAIGPPANDPIDLAEAGSPSDNDSLTEVLHALGARGFASSFRPASRHAALVCGTCGAITDAGDIRIVDERRLEGASDPADEVVAVAAFCPMCGTGGVVVLGFGPEASPEDADIVVALQRPAASKAQS